VYGHESVFKRVDSFASSHSPSAVPYFFPHQYFIVADGAGRKLDFGPCAEHLHRFKHLGCNEDLVDNFQEFFLLFRVASFFAFSVFEVTCLPVIR
jgi:hypothetical protein